MHDPSIPETMRPRRTARTAEWTTGEAERWREAMRLAAELAEKGGAAAIRAQLQIGPPERN